MGRQVDEPRTRHRGEHRGLGRNVSCQTIRVLLVRGGMRVSEQVAHRRELLQRLGQRRETSAMNRGPVVDAHHREERRGGVDRRTLRPQQRESRQDRDPMCVADELVRQGQRIERNQEQLAVRHDEPVSRVAERRAQRIDHQSPQSASRVAGVGAPRGWLQLDRHPTSLVEPGDRPDRGAVVAYGVLDGQGRPEVEVRERPVRPLGPPRERGGAAARRCGSARPRCSESPPIAGVVECAPALRVRGAALVVMVVEWRGRRVGRRRSERALRLRRGRAY